MGRGVSLSYPPFSMIVSCTPRRSLYNTLTRRSYTLHCDQLQRNWELAQNHEPPVKVPPLE